MSFWHVFISKLGVRFYSCLHWFTYLIHFMKEEESLSYKATFNFVYNERVNAFFTNYFYISVKCFLYRFYLGRIKVKSRRSAFFSIFHELDFVTKCYTYIGFFLVEGCCLLLLFSLADISWIFQCQLNLHHLSIKNILQMMLLTSKFRICGRSTGEIFPGISEKELLCLSKTAFSKAEYSLLAWGCITLDSLNKWLASP